MSLPVPKFSSVKEASEDSDGEVIFIIAPDKMAGSRHRYSVIEIWRFKGEADCIGREIPLDIAREIVVQRKAAIEAMGKKEAAEAALNDAEAES